MAGPVFPRWGVEMQLAGAVLCQEDGTELCQEDGSRLVMDGFGYVDITADVVVPSLTWSKGKLDTRQTGRVAGIGTLQLELNNSVSNSAGLAGCYSPGHANCRPGFARKRAIRWYLEYGGVRVYKWQGYVSNLKPVPGVYGQRHTLVEAQSTMILYHGAQRQSLQELQIEVRSDQVYEQLTRGLERRPPSWRWSVNPRPLNFVFAAALSQKPTAASELNKVAASAWDLVLEQGNAQHGGSVRSVAYADLLRQQTVQADLAEGLRDLQPDEEEPLYSRVSVTIHPRKAEEDETILWQLDQAEYMRAGITVEKIVSYSDGRGGAVAALDIDRDPEPGVDYYFDRVEADLAGALSGSLLVEIEAGATQSVLRFTPRHNGYLNNYFLRGKLVRAFNEVTLPEDISPQPGEDAELRVDLPYQSNAVFGASLAKVLRDDAVGENGGYRVSFSANRNDTHMQAALLEPGAVVTVSEWQTGVDNWLGIIVGEQGELSGRDQVSVTWTLLPLPPQDALLIGVPGRCEIDGTHVVRGV
ncbi:MAG: hypothetical protein KF821_08995 [Anaerolineales bacterium]|nr:hypothetical protein [Anaerolineales bacterium]